MTLPIKTTADDVRTIAAYLKNKPTGATIDEAKAAVGSTYLDGRKMKAYEDWKLVSKDGDRLKLLDLGWQLVRQPASEKDVFRTILRSQPAYSSVLEWAHHQPGVNELTTNDVAAHWHQHHRDVVGTDNDTTLKNMATTFLRLAEAAGLGVFVLGRRSQPTRLDIAPDALRGYIEGGPDLPPWTQETEGDDLTAESEDIQETDGTEDAAEPEASDASPAETPSELRVFISHGKNMEIVGQVETMLGLANIKAEIAVKEESTAIPVPDKVFSAMRRCSAGIIVVTPEDEDDDGNHSLNENVLIEIGAAFVLYEKRVVLLWDKRIDVPSNLQGLYRCEFEGDELSWGAGMKLMKAIQQFRQ